ncbi:MAG: hypothetical protein HYY18_16505 [Planctomycetes bacterium]|nr:hypothetical protein [Planctomycetota bacterium]
MIATRRYQIICSPPETRDRSRFRILVLDSDRPHADELAFCLTAFGLPSCSAGSMGEAVGLGDVDVIVDFCGIPCTEILELQKVNGACLIMSGEPERTVGLTPYEARVLDWQITCALVRKEKPVARPA